MLYGRVSKILIFIIIAVIIFLAGHYSVDKAGLDEKVYTSGYNDAWVKASGIVENSSAFPRTPDEIYSISGEIKSVSGSMFTINAYPVSLNPLSDDSKTTIRQITIIKDTEIVRQTVKTPEEINEIISQGAIVAFFTEESVSLDKIKEGEIIQVVSDVNIKHESEIIAIKIIVSTALM